MPTPIFIFDTAPLSKRRSWAALMGNATDAEWNMEGMEFRTPSGIISNGVIVIHRGQFVLENADILGALKTVTDKHEKLVLIVVSGGSQSELPSVFPKRCYFRKAPVASEWTDEHFASCFRRFMEGVERGSIDFTLLEPANLPCILALAVLCQGYLVARNRGDLLGLNAAQFPIMSSLPEDIAKTVTEPDWWRKPFDGINLVDAVAQECGGDVPSEIRKLLDSPGGEDETTIAAAHSKIRELLKQ